MKDVFAVRRSQHHPDNERAKPVRMCLNQLILTLEAATPGVLNQAIFHYLGA
ncbi:MAG: hypothetical protein WB676_05305 [Bryobacteraceae bacterium]